MPRYQHPHPLLRGALRRGDARHLPRRIFTTGMRIEPRGRAGHRIRRHRRYPSAATRSFSLSSSAALFGAACDAADAVALQGTAHMLPGLSGSTSFVAEGHRWKYLSPVKPWPIRAEPTTLPSRSSRLPFVYVVMASCVTMVMPSGSASLQSKGDNPTTATAGRNTQFISHHSDLGQKEIDQLDSGKGRHDASIP